MKKLITTYLTVLIILLFLNEAYSIPAFARKYNMSCNVCHYAPPKLRPFGEEFAGNGFQIPDNEPRRAYKETGDDELLLMKEFPLALRMELFGQYQNGIKTNADLRSPYIVKIMSGGNIYKNISYYIYYFLSERGEMAGIEDAFISFNDLAGSELDLTIGQFQVSDPLFKRELRLEQEDYKIYATSIGKSKATLKYDRGIVLNYGLITNTDLALQIINGNGIGTIKTFDEDNYKNLMFRVSQEVMENFRLGAFGYYGKEKPNNIKNELWMTGADLTIAYKNIELNAQYVFRSDENPNFDVLTPSEHIKTHGGFAELIFSPDFEKSKWFGYFLYNKVDSQFDEIDYDSYTGGISYSLKTNIRIIGEYSYIKQSKISRFTVGIVTAF